MLHATTNLTAYQADMAATMERLGKLLPWLKVTGQRVAIQARATARARGGRHFWRDLARSVQVATVSGTAVSVHTNHVAAAQKEFGGTIRPKTAKALTIPIADEARGKRASEFEDGGRDLFVLPSMLTDTIGVLGYAEATGIFHALYVLRTHVDQDPEPWWPTLAQTGQYAIEEADRYVKQALRK